MEACINEYGSALYSFCEYLARNRQEAEDLYQDTFLKFIELESRIDWSDNPKSYLLSIALRIWKNRKRKYAWRRRIVAVRQLEEERDEAFPELQEDTPEETVLEREIRRMVREAVGRLPERLKVTVLLYYMEELPTRQIATVMKVPTGTVLSRLHQARKLLKRELECVLDGKEIG